MMILTVISLLCLGFLMISVGAVEADEKIYKLAVFIMLAIPFAVLLTDLLGGR